MKWVKKNKLEKKMMKKKKNNDMEESNKIKSFSLSRVLPLSWISKLTKPSSGSKTAPPYAVPLDRVEARYPLDPEPCRLSVGDELMRVIAQSPARAAVSRSPRNNSLGELELRQHIKRPPRVSQLPGTRWPPETQSDGDFDSASFRRRRRPPTHRRQQQKNIRQHVNASSPVLRPIQIQTNNNHLNLPRKSFEFPMHSKSKPKIRRVHSPRLLSTSAAAAKGLERFAVVKRTSDPQREFRESMAEMIWEKGMIGRPEAMERLLAAYLSLNSDEHHDVIVDTFRQLWFDLACHRRSTAAKSGCRCCTNSHAKLAG